MQESDKEGKTWITETWIAQYWEKEWSTTSPMYLEGNADVWGCPEQQPNWKEP